MATLFLIVIYAAFISLGLPDALLGTGWPVMMVEYDVPVGWAGIVAMVVSVNTIISSLLSGRILSRFGTGRVTFVSVLMTATALLGFSIAPNFFWLVLLAIPLGLGAGSVDAGLNDYVARHYKAHHMSWLHSFWGVGAMTGPIIISQFIGRGESWRNGYLTVAIIQFGLVVLLFATLPVWDKVAKMKRTFGADTDASNEDDVVQPKPKRKSMLDRAKGVFSPLQIEGVWPALIVFLLYTGIEATVGLWGSSFLVRIKGMDAAPAAQWVSLYYGSITAGRFISGFITMRLSSKNLIRLGEVLILIGALFLLLPLPEGFLLMGFMLVGLGCAPIFPSMLHETPNRFGDAEAQNIMGFQMAVAYIGMSFLPPLFGAVASISTFNLFPIVILLYIIVMLVSSEQVNRLMAHKRKVTRVTM